MTHAARHRASSGSGLALLLIEPDPWREASLSAFLRAEGYDVQLAEVPGRPPDLVLVDFRTPAGENRARFEELKAAYPETKALAFVGEVNSGTVFPLLLLGIKGVLPATARGEELLLALSAVREGSLWTPRAVLSQWIDRIASLGFEGVAEKAFTKTEQKILEGLSEELSNKEIARRVGIAEPTVKGHVGRLLRKTGTKDRRELARFIRDTVPALRLTKT